MTDSWGRKYLEAPNVFRVRFRSGDVNELRLKQKNYTVVIIMGSICNITMKDRDIVTTNMRKEIKRVIQRTKKVAQRIPVIIMPTIGIDLAVHNSEPTDFLQQDSLNGLVLKTNKMLISCNKADINLPWISKAVHNCQGKGCLLHKYYLLHYSCHFN